MATPLDHSVVIGAGPIGRAVVDALSAGGHEPTVVTRRGTAVEGARSVAADLSDPESARAAISGATVVFQCAAPPYHRWGQEFPTLQRTILDACAATGAALIAAENLYGYGEVAGPRRTDTPMRPTSRKGAVRAQMWSDLQTANDAGTVPTAAVRASDFFGPGVISSVYGQRFFDAIARGRRVPLLGSADSRHAITFAPDFGRALVAVGADRSSWGRAWHAPTAPAVAQRRIVEIASAALGVPARWRTVPRWQLQLGGIFDRDLRESVELLYQFDHDFLVDTSEFEAHFGQVPVALEDSLVQTARATAGP